MRDPHNIKYRAVNLGNKTIAEKLLPANGAFEVGSNLLKSFSFFFFLIKTRLKIRPKMRYRKLKILNIANYAKWPD